MRKKCSTTKLVSIEERQLFRNHIQALEQPEADRVADEHQPCLHLDDPNPLNLQVNAEDRLYFTRPGIQQSMLNKLKRGTLRIETTIDLHGHTIDEARAILTQALLQHRSLLVVHGKGLSQAADKPKLKNYVAHWLTQCSEVLAYCSAQGKDGGTGAVYVLVKKR